MAQKLLALFLTTEFDDWIFCGVFGTVEQIEAAKYLIVNSGEYDHTIFKFFADEVEVGCWWKA